MLAFIGGTGPEGRGLALRFALASEACVIGSRDTVRAQAAVDEVNRAPGVTGVTHVPNVQGMDNASAVADIVFIVVPFQRHEQVVRDLRPPLDGKILVDVVASMEFVQGKPRAVVVPEGSAAEQAKTLVPTAKIVGAFQNLSARELLVPDRSVDCDIIVCADDQPAKQRIMAMAEKIRGVRSVDGGPLSCARYVEQITPLLLNIQCSYARKGGPALHPSVRIVGIDSHAPGPRPSPPT